MKRSPITRKIRQQVDLAQLKRQAKELLERFRSGDEQAVAEVHTHYHGADPATFALHHAHLVLARSYGFDSWPKLKAYAGGLTIGHLAEKVRTGDVEEVRAILQARPELINSTVTYSNEHRPIHYAVQRGSAAMVRLLMQSGADARRGIHPYRAASTALAMAEDREATEIVGIILEEEARRAQAPPPRKRTRNAKPESPPPQHDEEAFAAVAEGRLDWLRARHAAGQLTNPVSWSTGGLLTAAVRHNQPETLRLLLEFGFDPDEHVRYGEGAEAAYSQGKPLWDCAAQGKIELAGILLAGGADPNASLDSSGTPVYAAMARRHPDIVELLQRYGGVVPADAAAIYRQTEVARAMIAAADRGEQPPSTVAPGRSLEIDFLEFGASGGSPEIVRLALERIDWPRDDPRWYPFLARPLDFWNHIDWLSFAHQELDRGTYIDCFRAILARCHPNLRGSFGRTVLHEVAAIGDHVTEAEAAQFAEALLAAGARFDIRDEMFESTALGWACRCGRVEVARLLLEHGADPHEPDSPPWARPAAWARKKQHAAIEELLARYSR